MRIIIKSSRHIKKMQFLLLITSFFYISIVTGMESKNSSLFESLPPDILHEINKCIHAPHKNFTQVIGDRDAFFSINKEMRKQKYFYDELLIKSLISRYQVDLPDKSIAIKNITKKLQSKKHCYDESFITIFGRIYDVHPLLAGAFIQKRADWVQDIKNKGGAGRLHVLPNIALPQGRFTETEGKLAVLIKKAKRMMNVYSTGKAQSITNYLDAIYGAGICARYGTITLNDTLVWHYPWSGSFAGAIITEMIDNEPIKLKNNNTGLYVIHLAQNGNFDNNNFHYMCYVGVNAVDILDAPGGIYFLGQLRMNHNITTPGQSTVYRCKNSRDMYTFLSNFKYIIKDDNGFTKLSADHPDRVPYDEYTVPGDGALLAYDREMKAIKVFDKDSKLLLKIDAKP